MNIDERNLQLELYGKLLTGLETELAKAQLLRVQYLKAKLRGLLIPDLGDLQDIMADTNKSLLLGVGILSGVITNAAIISRYKAYVTAQVQLYGGPAAIMDKLEANGTVLLAKLQRYNEAKTAIAACIDAEDVALVDTEAVKAGK